MIDRYTTPAMRDLWSDGNTWDLRLRVELAILDAQQAYGYIPAGTVEAIRSGAKFDLGRIAELEKETRHDIMAFVKCVQEGLGPEGRFFHFGITSYDVQDTAHCMQLRDACTVLLAHLVELRQAVVLRAREHRGTLQVGRTHGIHAEPITFGLKLAGWVDQLNHDIDRLTAARTAISVGKVSGAVGTYANMDPRVEASVCDALGLVPAPFTTQIISRDRHAQVMTTLGILAGTLERIATEIRNLARTEIMEVQEYFAPGQKGSSAMPHKRNPWNCETVTGLARIVRGNVVPSLEVLATWHERDLSNSSMERITWPDTTGLVDFMLQKLATIVSKMIVYPENMKRNLFRMGGLVCSEQVMMALVGKGISREDAYGVVQGIAARVLDEGVDFRDACYHQGDVAGMLSRDEIAACFDLDHHLRHVGVIFERLGI